MENQSSPLKRANLCKYIAVRVTLLDESVQHFHVSTRALGQHLYNQVISKLQLIESDYFDLEYVNKEGVGCWLDHLKAVVKQCTQSKEYIYNFGIKFYAPYPNMLEDEYTRYLFALQIKKDIYLGYLHCNINTAALLLAFIAQSEIGDFLEDEYVDYTYLSALRLTKQANEDFLIKVMECHRTLVGQSPGEADYNLLDTARKVESYGIRLHSARDQENLPLKLSISHQGILVYQNRLKVNTFSWAKVRKLSFKRKRFYVKLHSERFGYFKDVIEFIFNSRNECKNFWKQCIEHHAFFRCQAVRQNTKRRSKVLSKGSSFRYTGRTQKQLLDCVRETIFQRPQFERSQSLSKVFHQQKSPYNAMHMRYSHMPGESYSQYKAESQSAGECRAKASMGKHIMSGGTASSASYTMNSSAASARSRTVSSSSESSQHQKSHSQNKANFDYQYGHVPRRSTSRSSLRSRNRRSISHSPPPGSKNRHPHPNNNLTSNLRLNDLIESPINAQTLPAAFGRGYGAGHQSDVVIKNTNKATDQSHIPNYTELARLMTSGSGNQRNQHTDTVIPSPTGTNGSYPYVMSDDELRSSLTYLRKSQQRLDDLLIATMAAVGVEDPALTGLWSQNATSNLKKTETDNPAKSSASNTASQILSSMSPLAQTSNYKDQLSTLLPSCQTENDIIIHDTLSSEVFMNSQRTDPNVKSTSSSNLAQFPGYTGTKNNMNRYLDAKKLKAVLLYELKQEIGVPVPPFRSASSLGKLKTTSSKIRTQNHPDLLLSEGTKSKVDNLICISAEPTSDDEVIRPASAEGSRLSITRDPSLNLSRGGSLSRRSSTSSGRRSHISSKKRANLDKSYYLIKEVLMTERTYIRNLDIICIWFRKAVASGIITDPKGRLPDTLSKKIFSLLDPIHEQHSHILKQLENRVMNDFNSFTSPYNSRANSRSNLGLNVSESNDFASQNMVIPSDSTTAAYRIGDILLQNLCIIPLYKKYLETAEELLLTLDNHIRLNDAFRENVRNFESQKTCYLPLYAVFLAPAHRILQYRQSLERLLRHIGESHSDTHDCKLVLSQLQDLIQSQWDAYKRTENTCKLLELQRDIFGFQQISTDLSNGHKNKSRVCPIYDHSRQFIREGWLQKLGKKGYQQRMFFMFSDQLVYANKVNGNALQFNVHGQFPLHDLMIEESEPIHSFTIYSGNRCFLAAANSQWQRDRWLEDISRAILAAKSSSSLGGNGNVDNGVHSGGQKLEADEVENSSDHNSEKLFSGIEDRNQIQQRSNMSLHVCWHRNCSLTFTEILRANENELSGYLLRKFKNSNGWQKLWVVFTQLCLFFYKNYQDDCPLATLPLLGYHVCQPVPEDQIRKEYVFKLVFKNHVYFFRVDNQFTYERWVEVLTLATGSGNKIKSTSTSQLR